MLDTLVTMPLMLVEILFAELMFCANFKRAKNYVTRLVFSTIVGIELVIAILFVYYLMTDSFFTYVGGFNTPLNSVFKFFLYMVIFGITIVCIKLCFESSLIPILFCCSSAYAAQHMAINISNLVLHFVARGGRFDLNALSGKLFSYCVEIAICAVVYLAVYFVFVRGKVISESGNSSKRKLLFCFAVIFVCTGISRICADNVDRGSLSFVAEAAYAIVCCLFILNVSSGLNKDDISKREIELSKLLIHKMGEQYKLNKENIDLINIKCHDLKHQINSIRQGSSPEELDRIEQAVMIYSSTSRTGNTALDSVMSEKNLFCVNNDISLTCMVDGRELEFMDETDVYSLFGNALTNAIESVMKIKDSSKRSISVNLETVGNMLVLHFENYYEGDIVFEGKLPKTSRNADYHGYGMKSMSFIAKKYGGSMNVSIKDGKFGLDLVFPKKKIKRN